MEQGFSRFQAALGVAYAKQEKLRESEVGRATE